MRHLWEFYLLLSLLLVSINAQCPLSLTTGYKNGVASFCSEYNAQSCCTADEDATLETQWTTKVVPKFGSDGCGHNIKNLLCAWTCGPDQAAITDSVPSASNASILNASIFASNDWTNSFYQSCYDVCIPVAGGQLVGAIFATPSALLSIFNSQNDNTYTPDVGKPYLYYYIGNSTAGDNWNGANGDGVALSASGNDTVGCVTDKGSDGVRSVELFLSLTNLILAVFALSFLY